MCPDPVENDSLKTTPCVYGPDCSMSSMTKSTASVFIESISDDLWLIHKKIQHLKAGFP
jgi:hypothetical protein